jgi:hypothetical protein
MAKVLLKSHRLWFLFVIKNDIVILDTHTAIAFAALRRHPAAAVARAGTNLYRAV